MSVIVTFETETAPAQIMRVLSKLNMTEVTILVKELTEEEEIFDVKDTK